MLRLGEVGIIAPPDGTLLLHRLPVRMPELGLEDYIHNFRGNRILVTT